MARSLVRCDRGPTVKSVTSSTSPPPATTAPTTSPVSSCSTPTRATASSSASPTACPRARCRARRSPASRSSVPLQMLYVAANGHMLAIDLKTDAVGVDVQRRERAGRALREAPPAAAASVRGRCRTARRCWSVRATTAGGTTSTARPARCSASSIRRTRRSRTTWRVSADGRLGDPRFDVQPEGRQGRPRRHRRAGPQGAAIHDLLRDGAPAHHQPRRQPGVCQRERPDWLRDWRHQDRQDAQARGASGRRVEGQGLQPRHRDDARRERDLDCRSGERRLAGLGQSGRRPQSRSTTRRRSSSRRPASSTAGSR